MWDGEEHALDWFGSEKWQVTGRYKCGNESLGSIKCVNLLTAEDKFAYEDYQPINTRLPPW